MKKVALILVSSLMMGCASQTEYTFTEIKVVPKTAKKATVKPKSVSITTDGKRTDNKIVVYAVGTTVNEAGDLVGPHKVYRVVETSHWILGKPKIVSQTTFVKKETPTDQLNKAVTEAKSAAKEAKDARDSVQEAAAKGRVNPTPSDAVTQQVENGFFPSPTDADEEALKRGTQNFSKATADPNVP